MGSDSVAHILGCGDTGQYFDNFGFCIGVNDSGKFGKKINTLLFLNRPSHFTEDRLKIIRSTSVDMVVTYGNLAIMWKPYFDNIYTLPELRRWTGTYDPKIIYHTNNSPFTAMAYAAYLGFKEIVLWGVDFKDHKWLKPVECVPDFSRFREQSKLNIYKGHKDSNLNLPVWK
jgi:hypothetical protein